MIAAGGSVLVSFKARVAATDSHHYYAVLKTSRCGSGSPPVGRLTRGSPIGPQPETPAGTRVHANLGNPGCSGPIHGRVVLVTDGPDLILDTNSGHGTHIVRTVGTVTPGGTLTRWRHPRCRPPTSHRRPVRNDSRCASRAAFLTSEPGGRRAVPKRIAELVLLCPCGGHPARASGCPPSRGLRDSTGPGRDPPDQRSQARPTRHG
jgi:hypothetical protein